MRRGWWRPAAGGRRAGDRGRCLLPAAAAESRHHCAGVFCAAELPEHRATSGVPMLPCFRCLNHEEEKTGEMWKEINWSICCWIFANAAFGDVLAMGLYFYGLRTTSAAYSSIFLNMIPIATFVIAIVLRAENLALGHWPGKMKLLGMLLCVGGTMLVNLLKGPLLHLWPTNMLGYSQAPTANTTGAHHNMVVGTLWLCGSCMSYALYFIIQERLVKVFPSTYWMASLTSLVGSIQALVVGVFLVRDRVEWKLHWNLELLTVVYSGVLNTGLAFLLLSWVICQSGPNYPTMFNSVFLVMTTVLDSVLLGTQIYLGSVLGTVIIVVGMYAFLWGKGTELKHAAMAMTSPAQEAQQDEQKG